MNFVAKNLRLLFQLLAYILDLIFLDVISSLSIHFHSGGLNIKPKVKSPL